MYGNTLYIALWPMVGWFRRLKMKQCDEEPDSQTDGVSEDHCLFLV